MLGSAGRNVRCGSCGHSWHQMPPDEVPELELEDEDPPAAEAGAGIRLDPTLDKLDEQRKRVVARRPAAAARDRPSAQAVGWILLLLVVAGLLAGVWFGREQIMAWAPGTVRFYEMAGLHALIGDGLELRDVVSERRVVEGESRLVVEGTIVNVSEVALPIPPIRASLIDPAGVELSQWTFGADSESLPPGGFTTFQTSAVNPPEAGNLTLVFIEAE